MTDTSDHDELVRLAGELALLNLPTDRVLSAGWHAKGTALLDRLRDRQQQMAMGHQRLAELARLTGIS